VLVTIIIPVYNEKNLITELLKQVIDSDIQPFLKEIIIVDDGSTDGTTNVLKEYSRNADIKLITHPENSGKASAIKSALKIATGDVILIQDADLEYSPQDYKRLLEPFSEEDTQVVYGSRFLHKVWPVNMKVANWLANKVFTFLVNLLYKVNITDEGTAYKLFRRDVIRSIEIKSSGFEFCPEVTAKLLKRGFKIIEVPVFYMARDRKGGKKPGIVDGFKVLWTIIKYRFMK
jgi:glycosyltransferase involved in cell wall biosynthesis